MRVAIGDVSLRCEIEGEGTPLVLTHGLGNDLHFWDGSREAFARYHRVLRWDVRGFGASDKPAGPYRPETFADDLARLLSKMGLERVHLLGISMGGVIAQRFALDFPDRLRSMILVSTSSEVGPRATANWQRLADAIERHGFSTRIRDASRSFAPAFAARHPELVRRISDQTLANDPAAYAAAARAVSDYHWTHELARTRTPALILQGLDDLLTPPAGSVKMSRALARSRLLLIPGAGHNLPLEQPLVFQSAVLAFTGAVDALLKPIASAQSVR
jgi:3-oxoadipate enol-lactonase